MPVKPYDKRETKVAKKAIASTAKSVSPVKKIPEKSKKMILKPDVGGTKSKKDALKVK